MKSMNTYLIFNGQCRPAMEFYQQCLGGDLHLSRYADMPGGVDDIPKEAQDWIIHAFLSGGPVVLMASDTQPGMPVKQGDNFFISIQCESLAETERLFNALAEGGKIDMALGETFWAEQFGMLTDRFGIKWMFNLAKPQMG